MNPFKNNISNNLWGRIVVVVGVIALSPDSLSFRLVRHLPNGSVLIYKYGLFVIVSIILFFCYNKKSSCGVIYAIGFSDIGAGILWGLLSFTISFAIQHTSAANALVIYSIGPSILTSYFTHLLLRDPIPWRTLISGGVCFASILLIFSTELTSTTHNDVIGSLSAMAAAVIVGVYFVYIEYIKRYMSTQPDVFVINAIAGIIVAGMGGLIGGVPTLVTSTDFGYLCIGGLLIIPVSLSLITLGSQLILPSEASMMMLLEVVLGPLWVWLGGYERPPEYTIYGGILVIGSLFINSVLAIREERERAAEVAAAGNITSNFPIDDSEHTVSSSPGKLMTTTSPIPSHVEPRHAATYNIMIKDNIAISNK